MKKVPALLLLLILLCPIHVPAAEGEEEPPQVSLKVMDYVDEIADTTRFRSDGKAFKYAAVLVRVEHLVEEGIKISARSFFVRSKEGVKYPATHRQLKEPTFKSLTLPAGTVLEGWVTLAIPEGDDVDGYEIMHKGERHLSEWVAVW